MRRPGILVGSIVAFLLGTVGSTATADSNQGENAKKFRAELKGFEEIPTLSTPGTGRFEARLSHDGLSVDYELQYQDTESNVRQAHIHLGAPAFNGGIMVFLCTNLGNGPRERRCARSRAVRSRVRSQPRRSSAARRTRACRRASSRKSSARCGRGRRTPTCIPRAARAERFAARSTTTKDDRTGTPSP